MSINNTMAVMRLKTDIKKCSHCGRQLVSREISNSECVSINGAILLTAGYCCHECNEYDENGLLPGEREYKSNNISGISHTEPAVSQTTRRLDMRYGYPNGPR